MYISLSLYIYIYIHKEACQRPIHFADLPGRPWHDASAHELCRALEEA